MWVPSAAAVRIPSLTHRSTGLDLENTANHYSDVIMGKKGSQITSLTIVYSTVYLSADLRKHQRSTPLTFVRGIHRGPVNSPHKGPVTRKMFPFDDVIMILTSSQVSGGLYIYSTGIATVILNNSPQNDQHCGKRFCKLTSFLV